LLVAAFPAELQAGVCAQRADCLVGVVCQRMRFFSERNVRAPECEVLIANQSVRAIVRSGQFSRSRLRSRRAATTARLLSRAIANGWRSGATGTSLRRRSRRSTRSIFGSLKRCRRWSPPRENQRQARRVSTPAAKAVTESAPREDGGLEIQADDDLASNLSEFDAR